MARAAEVLAVQGPGGAHRADLGQASSEIEPGAVQVARVVSMVNDRNGRGKKVIGRLVRAGTVSDRNGRGERVSVRIVRVGSLVSDRNGHGKKVIRFVVAVNPANVDPTVALVVVLVLSVSESVAHGETVSDRNGRGETVSDRNGRGETVSGRDVRGETVSDRNGRGESLIANGAPSAPSPMPNVVQMRCDGRRVAASSSVARFPMSGLRKNVGSTKVRFVHPESRALKRASQNDRVLGRFKRPSTLAR